MQKTYKMTMIVMMTIMVIFTAQSAFALNASLQIDTEELIAAERRHAEIDDIRRRANIDH
jgi:hypothetical protein